MNIQVFPSENDLAEIKKFTPDFMYPNNQPYAVVAPEYLSKSQCDDVIGMYSELEAYKQEHCNAMTKQILSPMRGPLRIIEDFALGLNKLYWQYDLDPNGVAWLQSYGAGDSYQKHTDTFAGQSRKLTAVVMLTDNEFYSDGDLVIDAWPHALWCPQAQGTIVVFQSWHQHRVTEVLTGYRQTINMGFWGPQFK